MVVLFHGLEGGSRSNYATSLMGTLGRRGWRGVVAYFRGYFGEPNRLPRAYHARNSAKIAALLAHLHLKARPAPHYAVWASLGGQCLAQMAWEFWPRARQYVKRAAAVFAPVDMPATS